MNNIAQIDSSNTDKLLNTLDNENLRRSIIVAALKEAANVINDKTRENFKASISGASHYSKYIRKPFYQGVTTSVDKNLMETKVSIMPDFRMKFFEKQIKERFYKKKGSNTVHRTGTVKANHFFKNAITSTQSLVEQTLKRIIDNKLSEYIK